jgi:hypothetical protein
LQGLAWSMEQSSDSRLFDVTAQAAGALGRPRC